MKLSEFFNPKPKVCQIKQEVGEPNSDCIRFYLCGGVKYHEMCPFVARIIKEKMKAEKYEYTLVEKYEGLPQQGYYGIVARAGNKKLEVNKGKIKKNF